MVRLITEIRPGEEFADADRRLSDFVKKLNPHPGAYIPNMGRWEEKKVRIDEGEKM